MNIVPLRFLTLISTLFLVLLVTGCATTSLESDVAPGINTASWHTFYVQKLPADERGIEKIISEQLTSMGYDSTYGANSEPPDAVDAIVTYQDRWMWDITMYMIDLQIQFRDPATDVVLASGHSFRTSLARKSPEEMVKEVLDEIFPGSEPGMDKNTP